MAERLNADIAETSTKPEKPAILLQQADIDNYIDDVKQLLEILIGVGEIHEAERLRALAIELIASSTVRSEADEHLK